MTEHSIVTGGKYIDPKESHSSDNSNYSNVVIAGPREARNPNLDSDQRISYYACVPCL